MAGSDLLIVGRSISAATVVVYSSTIKLIAVLQNQPQILASVALPGLSHMKTSESAAGEGGHAASWAALPESFASLRAT